MKMLYRLCGSFLIAGLDTIRTHETIHPDWERAKAWAKATFGWESIVDVGLCAATVTVIGVVLFSLHKAMGNSAIVGTFPF